MISDPKPDPLPPLADAQRVLLEFFAPYDAKLARLREENAELRRAGATLREYLNWNDPGDESERRAALEAWDRIQEATP